MHARTVAQGIYDEVTGENLDAFHERYLKTDYAHVRSAAFRRAMELAQGLSEADQGTLMEIIRQVSVDTASLVLGIFEGTVIPGEIEEPITITYGGEDISNDIQSAFLVIEEEHQEAMRGV